MKAVVFNELGGPEVLQLADRDKESPKPGEVLIKVTSAGLNRADVLFQYGRYYRKPAFPSRTGKESAGIVEAAGEGAAFNVGDRVATLPSTLNESSQGGMAEYVVAPAESVVPTPKSVSDEDAGAVWMQYITAYGALNYVEHVQPGQHVVITAGSSSVGVAAIQLTNMLGGVSIATTTSAGKVKRLKELGAAHVIDVKNEDYVERVREISDGKGADIIFDAVTGGMMKDHIKLIRSLGTIFIYGVLDTSAMPVSPGHLIGKNAAIRGYSLFSIYQDQKATAAAVKHIAESLDSGKLDLVIDRRFPMTDVQDAFAYMESNQQCGKIVINP